VNESLLVFEGNNGELYWAEFTDSSGQLLDVVKYNPITEEALLGGGATDLLPWIGGALAVGGIAAAVGGSGGSSSSKDSTPVNPMENAERLVSQAEAEYNNALEILEQAQQDGLITPEEQQAVQDAINTAEEAKQVAQDAVNTLPAGTDKEGLQDRLDDLVDIVVPPVNDANENGIDDGDLEAEAAAELVAAAEAARAEQQEILDGLTDADDNGLITPEEYAQAEERLEELQGIIDVAKELAQNAVTGLDDGPAKDTLQDRLDAIEDLVIPAVTDFDGDGDVDADDAAIQAQLDAATTAVEDAEQAYDDLVAAIDAAGDEVSSEERADLLAQLEAAQQAKEDAQALVDALPETIQAEKDALDTRLDGLIDPEIPAVSFAYDDDVNLDMGNEISITAPEIVDQNVQVINLLESTGGIDAGTEVVLSGSTNSLAISISQTSLLAVADAYRVDVLDEAGNIVYSAVTQNSQLVGDVAGLGILGITGDDTLTTTIPDLPAGTYRVVVSNDASALTNLLDTDGTILNAVTIDIAGNPSQAASTIVDAQAPIITLMTNTTGDSTPSLQGTIDDPTATIIVTVDGINYTAVNNRDSTWTLADGQLPDLADGSYNVTVQAIDAAGNGSTITESLVVEAVLFANDDLNNVNVLDSVLEGNLNGVNGYTFGLLSTDVLSGVVDVNIATNGFRFTVSGDTTQDISIDVSGTTGVDVSIGSVTYANLLLINIDTGEIVATVQNGLKLEPWVLTTRLVANNVEFTNIPEGNYTIGFSSTSVDGFLNSLLEGVVDLNLLSASRITINDSTQYSTADAIGNVLAAGAGTDIADIGNGMRVTEVISAETTYAVNTPIANIGETAIAGSYGILYMQADGSYRYVSNGDANDVAKVDTFTYTVADAAGNTSQAYLNIRTDAEGATIIWNENDLQADGVITVNALDDETTVSIAQINTVSELLSKVEVVGAQATGTNGPVTGKIITNTTWTNTYTLSESFRACPHLALHQINMQAM